MSQHLPILVRGTGSYLPETVIDNQHFIDYLDTSDEWITTRTGIKERHWAPEGVTTSDLGAAAAKRALDDAGMKPDEIDAIIVATATGDTPFPATAAYVQAKIGARNVPAFDIGAACAGFLYGSSVAAGMVATGAYQNILLVGAETLSRFADHEDRKTVILFGDAAGAAVWSRTTSTDRGILYLKLGTDGDRVDNIVLPAGGATMPASQTTVDEKLHYIRMKGREVFKFAVLKMEEMIDGALEALNLKPDDLKLVIPHQSNARIIESMRERMKLPVEKMALNIDKCGNTSAASVPMALDAGRRDGRLHEGDHVLLLAVGAGLSWGVMVVRL